MPKIPERTHVCGAIILRWPRLGWTDIYGLWRRKTVGMVWHARTRATRGRTSVWRFWASIAGNPGVMRAPILDTKRIVERRIFGVHTIERVATPINWDTACTEGKPNKEKQHETDQRAVHGQTL